jgi:hypothetical protein
VVSQRARVQEGRYDGGTRLSKSVAQNGRRLGSDRFCWKQPQPTFRVTNAWVSWSRPDTRLSRPLVIGGEPDSPDFIDRTGFHAHHRASREQPIFQREMPSDFAILPRTAISKRCATHRCSSKPRTRREAVSMRRAGRRQDGIKHALVSEQLCLSGQTAKGANLRRRLWTAVACSPRRFYGEGDPCQAHRDMAVRTTNGPGRKAC